MANFYTVDLDEVGLDDGGFEDEKGTFTIYDGAKYVDFDSGDYVDDYGKQPLT